MLKKKNNFIRGSWKTVNTKKKDLISWVHLHAKISRTHKFNKSPSFCVLSYYNMHKMPLNANISVHDLWQIKHFSDITLLDKDTKIL